MSIPARTPAAAVAPRPAATTLILRDGDAGIEVLMVRRSPTASFMPGAYVFPGGAVDAADGDAAALAACDEPADGLVRRIGDVTGVGAHAPAFALAALRECFEECGLWLGAAPHEQPHGGWPALRGALHRGRPLAAVADAAGLRLATRGLQPWARWVTPLGVPKRFDTLFFVARAPQGQQPSVDAGETTTLAWVRPDEALAASAGGAFQMEFATLNVVRSLTPFSAQPVQALLDHAARQQGLPVVHPRLQLDGDGHVCGLLLPGEPGYDAAAGDGPAGRG